jgi:hypothetical protein
MKTLTLLLVLVLLAGCAFSGKREAKIKLTIMGGNSLEWQSKADGAYPPQPPIDATGGIIPHDKQDTAKDLPADVSIEELNMPEMVPVE